MSVNYERLPSCLGTVNVIETSTIDSNTRNFKIGCTCGCNRVRLLGYPLESQSLPGEEVFVGPLSIECDSCGKRSLVFDSERHGYDGENESSVAMTVTGEPNAWGCPECFDSLMELDVRLVYNVEPDEEMQDRAEDFFSEISIGCKCSKCNKRFVATSIDCI